ncbi:hypothetical protein Tco_0837194 [Tanacetum coccineum]
MAIEESKDLSLLALDELIGNLKVHEVVMEKDSKIYRGKKERIKSITLSDEEEYAMVKSKELEKGKEIDITCKSCQELKSKNTKLKETQVKFVNFDKSANSLRAMLNNQKLPSCKIGLGFDDFKASTSETKIMNFVGSSAKKAMDESTLPGSVSRTYGEKGTQHIFSPPMSSRSDFVITKKKLIHNRIDESKKPSLKPSLKSGIGYVKTESRSKTPHLEETSLLNQDTTHLNLGETLDNQFIKTSYPILN